MFIKNRKLQSKKLTEILKRVILFTQSSFQNKNVKNINVKIIPAFKAAVRNYGINVALYS